MKIAVFFPSYGFYHLARLQAFHEKCLLLNWQVTAISLADSVIDYPWETDKEKYTFTLITLLQNKVLEDSMLFEAPLQVQNILNQIQPDVIVVCGYSNASMLVALAWGKFYKKNIVLMSASKEDDAPRSWFPELIKSQIINQFNAALVGGKPQKRYLIKLGMDPDKIFFGYNVVGNDDFHKDQLEKLCSPLDKSYFLAINRFVPKKNLVNLIKAYANYRQSQGNEAWNLVLCGDGELRLQLEKQVDELSIREYVHLPGFLQQEQILPYFAHAKCFIHASIQEQWGLVVNEAMAAGLPVIVSNCCGCFEDLVMEGINGFGFNPENQQELTNLMIKVSSGKVDLELMGKASLKHIEKYSPDYFAEGLRSAIEFAMNKNS
jgi:glycosyltransferase involved in cell wall biosynthesis